ncbi:hypothetical protein ANO11243_074120 [Dothideomycetidae sp. 11243]|nr:hypothetical protein ANO11243_074120 [fungal sp. No.11243]
MPTTAEMTGSTSKRPAPLPTYFFPAVPSTRNPLVEQQPTTSFVRGPAFSMGPNRESAFTANPIERRSKNDIKKPAESVSMNTSHWTRELNRLATLATSMHEEDLNSQDIKRMQSARKLAPPQQQSKVGPISYSSIYSPSAHPDLTAFEAELKDKCEKFDIAEDERAVAQMHLDFLDKCKESRDSKDTKKAMQTFASSLSTLTADQDVFGGPDPTVHPFSPVTGSDQIEIMRRALEASEKVKISSHDLPERLGRAEGVRDMLEKQLQEMKITLSDKQYEAVAFREDLKFAHTRCASLVTFAKENRRLVELLELTKIHSRDLKALHDRAHGTLLKEKQTLNDEKLKIQQELKQVLHDLEELRAREAEREEGPPLSDPHILEMQRKLFAEQEKNRRLMRTLKTSLVTNETKPSLTSMQPEKPIATHNANLDGKDNELDTGEEKTTIYDRALTELQSVAKRRASNQVAELDRTQGKIVAKDLKCNTAGAEVQKLLEELAAEKEKNKNDAAEFKKEKKNLIHELRVAQEEANSTKEELRESQINYRAAMYSALMSQLTEEENRLRKIDEDLEELDEHGNYPEDSHKHLWDTLCDLQTIKDDLAYHATGLSYLAGGRGHYTCLLKEGQERINELLKGVESSMLKAESAGDD